MQKNQKRWHTCPTQGNEFFFKFNDQKNIKYTPERGFIFIQIKKLLQKLTTQEVLVLFSILKNMKMEKKMKNLSMQLKLLQEININYQ